MPIVILPSDLSSQISAGEIIERPASVIKEVVENSIDAGSKNIHIEIEKNGFQSIIVNDDGCGINKKELALAITHHATSKIKSLSDLDYIATFGFRGEALASIRAVSRLTLISCSQFSDVGWKIYSEGSIKDNIIFEPIAHPQGTTVIIENLFYNILIRLKFIKNKKLEFFKIVDLIKKIALSHFNINFSLKHNGKLIIKYNSLNNKKNKIERLKNIFNKININQLIEIKEKRDDIFLFVWVFPLQYFTRLKNIKYCYINRRFIHNDLMINAICSAYYKILGNKNLAFIVYLKIPSNHIDINIHPTKNEIQFHKPNEIYTFIYEVILHNLKKTKNKHLLSNSFDFLFQKKEINNLNFFNSNFLKMKTFFLLKKKFLYNDENNRKNQYRLNDYLKIHDFSFGKLLIVIRKYYGLIHHRNDFSLISLPLAQAMLKQKILNKNIEKKIIPEYFLINIKINTTPTENIILFKNRENLLKIGFNLIFKKKYVILSSIPCFLKKQNIFIIIKDFFSFLFLKKKILISEIVNWFYINIFIELKNWSYINGIAVLLEIEHYYPLLLNNPPPQLSQKINIDAALCMLKI